MFLAAVNLMDAPAMGGEQEEGHPDRRLMAMSGEQSGSSQRHVAVAS